MYICKGDTIWADKAKNHKISYLKFSLDQKDFIKEIQKNCDRGDPERAVAHMTPNKRVEKLENKKKRK